MDNFKKYQVQKGDTIESIAKKIGIPAAEIRAFHNRHCDVRDLVELQLPLKFIDYILLPTLESYVETKMSEQNAIKKVFSKSDNNNLRLTFVKDLKIEYGTIIHYKENNQLKNKIHFTSIIEFIKEENDFFIVLLQINQVYINDKKPELTIEKLADKISKVLYPLKIDLNSKGQLHSILNIQDIQRRWVTMKPSILEYYKGGSELGNLISSFEKNIQSASLLKRSFEEHPFYQIYFLPLYQTYSTDLSFASNDFHSKTFQSVDEFQTATSKTCIRYKSIVEAKNNFDDEFQLIAKSFGSASQKIANNLKDAVFEIGKLEKGIIENMDFQYKLQHATGTIFSIVGYVNTRKDSKTVSTIEFETYERTKKKQKKEIVNPISKQIDWSSEIINKSEIKEQGFWDMFFGRKG